MDANKNLDDLMYDSRKSGFASFPPEGIPFEPTPVEEPSDEKRKAAFDEVQRITDELGVAVQKCLDLGMNVYVSVSVKENLSLFTKGRDTVATVVNHKWDSVRKTSSESADKTKE